METSLATARADLASVNNAFYDTLGDRWYDAYDDPVALLRAEGKLKNPWVMQRIRAAFRDTRDIRGTCEVLDIGCGAGFLANALAAEGHRVTGIDMSRGSLKVARSQAVAAQTAPAVPISPILGARAGCASLAQYRVADAYRLPFRDAAFDAVCALDFLEHVTEPERVIAEAARVLKPGGLFFFHTFNRNRLAWLIVIKGLEWFVRNTPDHMHVLPLFIKPKELEGYCIKAGLRPMEMTGIRPALGRPFWQMLATRRVPKDFAFRHTPSLNISYLGYARKT